MIKELMAGFMSLVLVAGLAGMVTAQTPDDLELRAEYLFDSGNPMADSSGNGFDVVGVGSAATVGVAEGVDGQAYQGINDAANSWVTVPADVWGEPGVSGSMTVEMMILMEEFIEGPGIAAPLSNDNHYFQFENGTVIGDTFVVNSNYWWFEQNTSSWQAVCCPDVVFETGTWHHWVYSQDADGEAMYLWFDGELMANSTFAGMDWDDMGERGEELLWLGSEVGASYPLVGRIDNVRFYKGWTASPDLAAPSIVNVMESEGATVVKEEGETTDSFTITLTSAPADTVTITLDPPSDDVSLNAEAPNDAVTLTFGTGDWDVAQTVTVKANDDGEAEGQESIKLATQAASTDENFNGKTVKAPAIKVIDNDAAGVVVEASGGSTEVTEDGANDSYSVVLTFPPSADVTVTVDDSGEPNQVTANGTADATDLTFTPANWDTPQVVTVAAIDDALVETSPHQTTLTHTVSSGDGDYQGLEVDSAVVSIDENECGAGPFDAEDLNQDCLVDLADLLLLVAEWASCTIATCL